MRSKVFFINGGAGRIICSIPAFEKYAETHDDFVIVCEGGMNFYKAHPVLHRHAYDVWHKGLFEDKIKDRDCVTPEPYRQWHYYNQKCSLAQAFDIEINELKEPRELPAPNIKITKVEGITALNTIENIKNQTGKDKCIVIQPFGRGVMETDGYIYDPTSRSFNLSDIAEIINKLKKDYAVVIMSEFSFDTGESQYEHALPQIPDVRMWAGMIQCADYFLGCDSVGQHIAKAVETKQTVVIGSTYPINISYPDDKDVDIIDIGEGKRTFSPIRLTTEDYQDMENDEAMTMTKDDIKNVIESCKKGLGKPTTRKKLDLIKPQQQTSCCDDPACPTSTVKTNKGFGS
mgnify:CR=1 FL=1|tara:strand:- start:2002 stop:3036 length:1035 start_codon:yes stop_codon:yes gene_type:complete